MTQTCGAKLVVVISKCRQQILNVRRSSRRTNGSRHVRAQRNGRGRRAGGRQRRDGGSVGVIRLHSICFLCRPSLLRDLGLGQLGHSRREQRGTRKKVVAVAPASPVAPGKLVAVISK